MYSNTVTLFSYDPADEKETVLALAETHVQSVVCEVTNHLSLREERSLPRASRKELPHGPLQDTSAD